MYLEAREEPGLLGVSAQLLMHIKIKRRLNQACPIFFLKSTSNSTVELGSNLKCMPIFVTFGHHLITSLGLQKFALSVEIGLIVSSSTIDRIYEITLFTKQVRNFRKKCKSCTYFRKKSVNFVSIFVKSLNFVNFDNGR